MYIIHITFYTFLEFNIIIKAQNIFSATLKNKLAEFRPEILKHSQKRPILPIIMYSVFLSMTATCI